MRCGALNMRGVLICVRCTGRPEPSSDISTSRCRPPAAGTRLWSAVAGADVPPAFGMTDDNDAGDSRFNAYVTLSLRGV